MSVTIREVALKAGVSTAAVSKVLHGGGKSVRVSEERAAHIRAIAESMQYRRNALARSLRTSRTHTVGVIFENLTRLSDGPLYTVHLLDGVSSVLFGRHFRITILPELAHNDIVGSLADGLLEGVIWCKLARTPEALKIIHECPIPIVAMNAPAPSEPSEAVFVACDNEGGIELAVEHLWELGHREILFLHEYEERTTPDCQARQDGFRQAMTRRGVEPTVVEWGWTLQDFPEWLLANSNYTAIVCWTERLAGRLLQLCSEYGIDVPRKLSIVGFDSTQYCETTSPRLTAVRQPIFDMAAYAAESLLMMIEGQRPPQSSTIFPCSLDARGSTGRRENPL
jgi:LacI family transcriptional regulator